MHRAAASSCGLPTSTDVIALLAGCGKASVERTDIAVACCCACSDDFLESAQHSGPVYDKEEPFFDCDEDDKEAVSASLPFRTIAERTATTG